MTLPASQTTQRLQQVGRTLEATFLGKSEVVRLMLVAAIAGEHMVLIGPPGTAKSALIRLFAKLVQANYFEYLLTRFTEPNEIFGPIDIQAFRERQLPAAHGGDAARGRDRLPRRGLQGQQRDPQLAARACSTSASTRSGATSGRRR